MFKPTKRNLDLLVRALNDDSIAFMSLVPLMGIPAKQIKAMLKAANDDIISYSNSNNVSREEAINYYVNDLLKNTTK